MEITKADLQKFVALFISTNVDCAHIVQDDQYPVITDPMFDVPVLLITNPDRFVLVASSTTLESLYNKKKTPALLVSKQVMKKIRASKMPPVQIEQSPPNTYHSRDPGYMGGYNRRYQNDRPQYQNRRPYNREYPESQGNNFQQWRYDPVN